MADMKKQEIKEFVKNWYSQVARGESCCSKADVTALKEVGYSENDIKNLPTTAIDASCGCGNPVGLTSLKQGETVLDIGSGGGIDCFLAAEKVGPKGKVIGVDLSEEMIKLADKNAKKVNLKNVEFRLGDMENLPLENESVDVIISNCVINLASDKQKVFNEAYRVLRNGGRMIVSDIVTEKKLPRWLQNSLEAQAACVGGALTEKEYIGKIQKAGFRGVEIFSKRKARIFKKKGDSLSEISHSVYHTDIRAVK
jgi:arsenite methyltransferase